MRILVCGSRTYGLNDPIGSYNSVKKELLKAVYKLTKEGVPDLRVTIIQGEASGADVTAKQAAKWFDWEYLSFPADWEKHGKAAGPIRNKQMLDEGKPDMVIAFWDGKSPGTKNMIDQATKSGVPVEIIDVG